MADAPKCKDCKFFVRVKDGACARGFFRVSVAYARAKGHACGEKGAWFEPKQGTSAVGGQCRPDDNG